MGSLAWFVVGLGVLAGLSIVAVLLTGGPT